MPTNIVFAMSRRNALGLLSLLGVVVLLLGGAASAHAQGTAEKTLRGRVLDAETGAPLPQANLRVADTYRGTITNAQGRYTIELDSLPVTVVIRYVGYETVRRQITPASDPEQTFQLSPSTVEMEEVVVTGSRNPGASIMRRVIERKQEWWPELQTYAVEAYNRFTLASDTTIVAIAESQTTAFWDAERGTREVVHSQRGTANLSELTDAALPAAATVLNLYRDEVEVFGNRLIGVTHPDALDYYDFTLDTTRAIDGRRAFRIRVEPESRLSSTVRGTVTVLDSAYAMLEARLRPTTSLGTTRMLKKVDIAFEQQFSNFGGPYWLPVDFRARRTLDVQLSAFLSFPDVNFRQVSRLSDYQVNVPVPDSLYDSAEEEERAVVSADSTANIRSLSSLDTDSLHGGGPFVPYSRAEQAAYARIDSTDAVQNAFEPGGLVGWLQDLGIGGEEGLSMGGDSDEEDPEDKAADRDSTAASEGPSVIDVEGGFPIFRFNRVEGGHLGARLDLGIGPLEVTARGGYNTGPSGPTRWSYGAEVTRSVAEDTELALSYHYGIDPRYRARSRLAPFWAHLSNSVWTLAGEPDYFDYLGTERVRVSVRQEVPSLDLDLALQLRNERHFSVSKTTDYGLLSRGQKQPPNPPVQEGWLRSVALRATVGDDGLLGIFPFNRVQADIEFSDSGVAASDFDFTRIDVVADAHVETFFQRRLFPNALDLRLDAGVSLGTPPLQRFGVVEASPLPYTPFGALRTLDDRPYQGEHHVAFFWEHNFRTVPFELIGWQAPVHQDVGILVHGGHGRAWIEDDTSRQLRRQGVLPPRSTDGMHHEFGLSINGLLYDSLRFDVTKRLDAPGLSIGVNVLRFL